ncbi:hypothetical protein E4634_05950 [Mangrovimicrobium sediminis]|uniref:Uncharacterized protein n=1 Tax=Mangrovimicrobium sediminis TaxID=2562682 RepID=A0A4Z0M5P4_9GAMM|nr:hypothetical protein [Haliea sp. SAOS-164]TGD74740.1 hypothetical protein E4634_05950 [Haliea sp. SAOS-164]
MASVKFSSAALAAAMAPWRTKTRIAQEMQELFPHKYRNAETPYRALRRAETGNFVDLDTAKCIARALGAELVTLLDASEPLPRELAVEEGGANASPARERITATTDGDSDAAGPPDTATPPAASASRSSLRRRAALAVAAAVVAIAGGAYLGIPQSAPPVPDALEPPAAGAAPVQQAAPRRVVLVVGTELRAADAEFAARLQRALPAWIDVSAELETYDGEFLADVVLKYDADAVVRLASGARGRYLEVSLIVASRQSVNRVWTEAIVTSGMPGAAQPLAGRFARRLEGFLTGQPTDAGAGYGSAHFTAVDAYVKARAILDDVQSSSMSSLLAASGLLQSAVQRDPDFALARAANCMTLAYLYWVDDARSYIDEASAACALAQAALPAHPFVVAAQATVTSRDGHHVQARKLLAPALAASPGSLDLHLAAAEVEYASYQREGNPHNLDLAMDQLRKAIALEPDNWIAHFWLGTLGFYSGDIVLAMSELKRAVALHPSEVALANLGTFAMCQGDLATARSAYQTLEEVHPASHTAPEMLGRLHHFEGDFAGEIALIDKSLKMLSPEHQPQIHQVFASLGDAYRLSGDEASARAHYETALDILRRDEAEQIMNVVDHAARAVYLARLAELGGDGVETVREKVEAELALASPESLGVVGHSWYAQAATLLRQYETAQWHWQRAIDRCPVYLHHPDRQRFVAMLEQLPPGQQVLSGGAAP